MLCSGRLKGWKGDITEMKNLDLVFQGIEIRPYADLKSKKFVVSVVLFNDLKKKVV